MSSQSSNRQPLSEQQRREAFIAPRSPVDRAAALREGPPPTPTKFLAFAAAVLAVVVLSGVLVERVAGNAPSTPRASSTLASPQAVGRSLARFMTLTPRHGRAPALTLVNQHGATWSLAAQRGRVVIVGFVNQSCNDLCPVITAELRRARQLVGVDSRRLTVALVNTDPHHLGLEAAPPVLADNAPTGTSTVFLTGPLAQINPIWRRYGISIHYYPQDGRLVHNDLLYFINPAGDETALTVPFGNESASGVYRLGATDIARFARGIALEVESLLR